MIIINSLGLGIGVISFVIGLAVQHLAGSTKESLLMMVAGASATGMDLIYRFKHPYGHWARPSGGGSLFFLPIWFWGILWILAGVSGSLMY